MAATKLRLFQDALRLLADARLNLIVDDVESQYALTDAWPSAVDFVLRQAPWRFALKTATPVVGGTPVAGFSVSYARPVDWLRTHSIFVVTGDGREHPVDVREHGTSLSTDASFAIGTVKWRYVGSGFADPEQVGHPWPETFAQAVAAYLAFLVAERVTGEPNAAGRMSQLFSQHLQRAREIDAEPESRWLPHQRSGEMLRGAIDLLQHACWRFAAENTLLFIDTGDPAPGFTHSFAVIEDILKVFRVYFLSSEQRECPVDFRENGLVLSANRANLYIRHTSRTKGTNPSLWAEPFRDALLAFLEAGRPEMPAEGEKQANVPDWYRAVLLAQSLSADPPDPWLPHQRSGEMLRGARDLLSQSFWRFATRTAAISAQAGTPIAGYQYAFNRPTDHVRTHKLFQLTAAGKEYPFDIREHAERWASSKISFYARYISETEGLDSTKWEEPFRTALLAYVTAGRPEMPAQDGEQKQVPDWYRAVLLAQGALADPPDPWLEHQLSGSFRRHVPAVMSRGNWWWALVEQQYSSLADQLPTDPAHGYPYRYPLPGDWFKSHALFVPWDGQECPINIRETAADWSTDAPAFVARYVSTAALDASLWPQNVEDSVLAFLDLQASGPEERKLKHGEFDLLFTEALRLWSRPDDDWLRFQLDGSYQPVVKRELEGGRWRFALRVATLTASSDPLPAELSTGVPEYSFAYRHIWPSDLIRTVRVYYESGATPNVSRSDIPFADVGGAYHADMTPVTVRYVSRLGLDSTKWTAHFRDAVLARLQYEEARNNPAMAQLAATKLAMYKDASREAEQLDDARDRVVRRGSRFVAGRYGWHSRSEPYDSIPTYIGGPPVIDP
jgi:hypothetical protein